MIAVFVYGKLGKVRGSLREIIVDRVKYDRDRDKTLFGSDTFLLRDWTGKTSVPLFKIMEGKNVAIKGRLVVEDGATVIVAEHIAGS
ncbi:MAG TPA: hypothetical protein VFD05_02145 [Bacilli bacterium]|nr:hypothetical protein [Bacilli bacterium]